MVKNKLSSILFLIILIEGFFTLSLELLVIRQAIPFVGNGTEMVSIIISSVLLPLATGYYIGGIRYKTLFNKKNKTKIRYIIINNIYIISLLTGIGFSYIIMDIYFKTIPISSLMISLAFYLTLFLVIPTFLLGQTVPLISNYFSSQQISKITGKILFISTTGSFVGSIATVLILMKYLGVSNTLILLEALLLLLVLLISKHKIHAILNIAIILGIVYGLGSFSKMAYKIEYENTYSTLSVLEENNQTSLRINNQFASMTENNNTSFYHYVNVINNMIGENSDKVKEILIVGSGGFTVGFNDDKNHYTYVDIDSDLKELVEKKFLKTPLKPNKTFYAGEIRKFLKETDKKFDIIVVDAYTNQISIPISLLSVDFYRELRESLVDNGFVVSNMVIDIYLRDKFSKNVDYTLRNAFELVSTVPLIHIDRMKYELSDNKKKEVNYLYIMRKDNNKRTIYTDDKNNANFDKFQ